MNHFERAASQDTCQMAALVAQGPCDFEPSLIEPNQPAAAGVDDRARVGIGILKAMHARPDARRNDAYVVSKPPQRG